MLITKRTAGLAKRGSKFVKGSVLNTTDPNNYSWVLKNDYVTFNFLSDEITGVKLASFFDNTGSTVWENKSRTLWIINTIRYVNQVVGGSLSYPFRADIYPTKSTFQNMSVVPYVDAQGTKYFLFKWAGIKYNKKYQNLTCSVTLTASLKRNEHAVDLSLSIESDQPIVTSATTGINNVVIPAVHFPKFIFKETGTTAQKDSLVLGTSIGQGTTIGRPAKYLKSPRFLLESFHTDSSKSRVYFSGQNAGGSPTPQQYKLNYGNPGWISIPCFVYGSRSSKEGFLLYARDPDGLHAKGFQIFSDDKSLHLRCYDLSDHEIVGYGMGGKVNPKPQTDPDKKITEEAVDQDGNITNNIGWSLRIRPFVSPTKWVDWYGYKLYKEEEIPYQESVDRISPSFYERAQDNDVDLRAIESPIYMNIFGYMTGTTSDVQDAAQFWQNELKNVTTPAKTYDPQFPLYMMTVDFSADLRTGDVYNTFTRYNGWESWAQKSGSFGVSGFKSPDHLPMNSYYSGVFQPLLDIGIHPQTYIIHPFIISSGSSWTTGISGMDLIAKPYYYKDRTITPNDWGRMISNYPVTSDTESYPAYFSSCFGVNHNYNQYCTITSGMVAAGVGQYHDTFGVWSYGCLATQHTCVVTGSIQHITHPQATWSHYFNTKQKEYVAAASDAITNRTVSSVTGRSSFYLSNVSEFASDANLPEVPNTLYYGVARVIQPVMYTVAGNTRSDELFKTYNASTYPLYSTEIMPPTWLQQCPSYSIAYGDRSIINYWAYPHTINLMTQTGAIPFGEVSGTSPIDGGTVFYPQTRAHELMQWRAWLAADIGWVKRLSVAHQSQDYWRLREPTRYTGTIRTDSSGIYYNTDVSGHMTYMKQYLRLAAYEPDYVYHGTTEHPLDSWTVSTSESDVFTRYYGGANRQPQTGDLNFTGKGMDTIIHSVYRQRDSESLLISLNNWYSGSSTFTSTFDPTTYGISDGYEVYSLDVSTAAHGTKTFLSLKSAGATYNINSTLSPATFSAIEIVPVTDITRSSLYRDLAVTYVPVAYAYDSSTISTTSMSISYTYGSATYASSDDPYVGYKAPMTQQITNNLPQWMAIRQNNESNGWKLINAWGMNLEEILLNATNSLADIWLTTADTNHRFKVHKSDINSKELLEVKDKQNLLFNSSFSIKDIARYNLPAGWISYSVGANLSTDSIITPYSVELEPDCTISQINEIPDTLYNNLTASVYIKSNNTTTNVKLILVIETTNGTTLSYSAALTSRSAEWRRLVLPITINARVRRIKYILTSTSSDSVFVSAPMLEVGGTVSTWTSSTLDSLPYVSSTNRFNLVAAISQDGSAKIPLFEVNSDKEFSRIQIPTRINKLVVSDKSLAPFTNTSYGRKVDYFQQVYEVSWEVNNNKIVERSKGPSTFDYFGKYSIRDLRYSVSKYGTRVDTETVTTILATAVRSNLLYCVVQEDYNGSTNYTLKIIIPRTPPNGEEYLESIIDFDLNPELNILYTYNQLTESIKSIAFSEVDSSYLVLTTTLGREIYYKLYFDYYYFDSKTNQLYTLENYNKYKIQVL